MPNLKTKIDGRNKKYSKTHSLQKKGYATVWKLKIAQWGEPASLKMF